jgi:aldehyde:ferredoxin oxidoreductase
MGNVLSMFMEATQQGYLNGYGPGLRWSDQAAMVELIPKIALRQGVGNVLAEGTLRAATKLGHPEIAMVAKAQAIPAYDPRGMKGMGLGYATSNRGACHLRGYTPASELGLIPLKTDPLAWQGKGELTKILQDLFAFMDSLDVCKFSSFAEGAEEYAAQYRTFLGLDNFTGEDVMRAGERIYNLERYYNNLAGLREGSDALPKRFLEEPSTMPGSEGQVCELDKMLEEYYEKRGWVNGVVPEETLRKLEIIG